jgi:hypothetical protein
METNHRIIESQNEIKISEVLQTPKHISDRPTVNTPVVESKYLTSQFLNIPGS